MKRIELISFRLFDTRPRDESPSRVWIRVTPRIHGVAAVKAIVESSKLFLGRCFARIFGHGRIQLKSNAKT